MTTAEQIKPERMQDWWRANHYSSNPPPPEAAEADSLLGRWYQLTAELADVSNDLWRAQQAVMAAHLAAVKRGED